MNTASVEIHVNGKPIKQYNHNGQTFVEARAGTEYAIKIKNHSWVRKLAVVTVDGVNVVSGKPQKDGVGQGYVVNGNDSLEIKGFRKDLETVGAFKFCKKGASYCNEQGLAGNNGVIGVRLYEEKQRAVIFEYRYPPCKLPTYPYPTTPPWTIDNGPYRWGELTCTSRSDNVTYSSMSTDLGSKGVIRNTCSTSGLKSAPDLELGTTWGQKINDGAVKVEFEEDVSKMEEMVIYYDTRANLEKIGICFKTEKAVSFPKAFGAEFAKPPKGWNG